MFIYTVIAQTFKITDREGNTETIKGPLEGIQNIGDLINRVNLFLIPFASIILFFVFVWGGYDFLTSAGNPDKISSGKMKMTTGIIGFILLILSYVLARFVGLIFGLDGVI